MFNLVLIKIIQLWTKLTFMNMERIFFPIENKNQVTHRFAHAIET